MRNGRKELGLQGKGTSAKDIQLSTGEGLLGHGREAPAERAEPASLGAESLFASDLQDPKERLGCRPQTGFSDIKSHAFFRSIDWDLVRQHWALWGGWEWRGRGSLPAPVGVSGPPLLWVRFLGTANVPVTRPGDLAWVIWWQRWLWQEVRVGPVQGAEGRVAGTRLPSTAEPLDLHSSLPWRRGSCGDTGS